MAPRFEEAIFHKEFLEDLSFWVRQNRKIALRIFKLIEDIMRDPFQGIGKPERLKHIDANMWSRRITKEHRIAYVIINDQLQFLQARYH